MILNSKGLHVHMSGFQVHWINGVPVGPIAGGAPGSGSLDGTYLCYLRLLYFIVSDDLAKEAFRQIFIRVLQSILFIKKLNHARLFLKQSINILNIRSNKNTVH